MRFRVVRFFAIKRMKANTRLSLSSGRRLARSLYITDRLTVRSATCLTIFFRHRLTNGREADKSICKMISQYIQRCGENVDGTTLEVRCRQDVRFGNRECRVSALHTGILRKWATDAITIQSSFFGDAIGDS